MNKTQLLKRLLQTNILLFPGKKSPNNSLYSDILKLPVSQNNGCLTRWTHHLSPTVNNNEWTTKDTSLLFSSYFQHRNKWGLIAKEFVGRTDNCIKNKFFSKVRKTLRIIIKYSRYRLRGTSTDLINRVKPVVLVEFLESQLNLKDTEGLLTVDVFDLIKKYAFMSPLVYLVESVIKEEGIIHKVIEFLVILNQAYLQDKELIKSLIKERKLTRGSNLIQSGNFHFEDCIVSNDSLGNGNGIKLHWNNKEQEVSPFMNQVGLMMGIVRSLGEIEHSTNKPAKTEIISLLGKLEQSIKESKFIVLQDEIKENKDKDKEDQSIKQPSYERVSNGEEDNSEEENKEEIIAEKNSNKNSFYKFFDYINNRSKSRLVTSESNKNLLLQKSKTKRFSHLQRDEVVKRKRIKKLDIKNNFSISRGKEKTTLRRNKEVNKNLKTLNSYRGKEETLKNGARYLYIQKPKFTRNK